jgi:hypothetical protein
MSKTPTCFSTKVPSSRGAFDTKEYYRINFFFKTLNTKNPKHINLTTINHNAAMLKLLKVLKQVTAVIAVFKTVRTKHTHICIYLIYRSRPVIIIIYYIITALYGPGPPVSEVTWSAHLWQVGDQLNRDVTARAIWQAVRRLG